MNTDNIVTVDLQDIINGIENLVKRYRADVKVTLVKTDGKVYGVEINTTFKIR